MALSPRTRFRRLLDRDPRRWVLALAAAEGLVGLAFTARDRRDLFASGMGLLFPLAFSLVMPAVGVVTMLAHGRLLLWTGRLLRGGAQPPEIHAAFAWSQVPFLAVAWPLALEVPLRIRAAEADPTPAWLARAISAFELAAPTLSHLATAGALAGAFLYLVFLAEAQRFSAWRALANQLLAALLGIGFLLAGVAIGEAIAPPRSGALTGLAAVPFLFALAVAADEFWRRGRSARATGPGA